VFGLPGLTGPGFFTAYKDGSLASHPCCVPFVEIEDRPRFLWRGAMLDVARHFLPKAYVFKFIDLLALHKMNVLHLHLTDDQGWRIEIKKYPRLTSVGSIREKTLVGRAHMDPSDEHYDLNTLRFDGITQCGYYTQEDICEIVAYASERHVQVVPEIEMPAHAQAAIAAYPFLGCTDNVSDVSPVWGIHDTIFKPSEKTFDFLADVLTEIMELFPSQYIHIGGDEPVKTQWRNSKECQHIKRILGLDDESELQSYFIQRVRRIVESKNRIMVGWDEILEGELTRGATIMAWREAGIGVEAASQGHDVIMTPQDHTYLNYYQAADHDSEPLAFAGTATLADVYSFEPMPSDTPEDSRQRILGVQAQLWSEYIPSTSQLEYMAFPRLSAIAEIGWSRPEHKNLIDFTRRLRQHFLRLDALDVNYRPVS
jgi:hexosaminidase